MQNDHVLSWATAADHDELADVMFDAVRLGSSPYTEAQRARWMPQRRHGAEWHDRLSRQAVAIATDGRTIAGFMSLDADGTIDLAHIRPDHRGGGLFRRLFERIEATSRARGDALLRVHASLMAEPAFAATGFELVERQTVRLGDELLARAEMTKRLSGTAAIRRVHRGG